MRIPTIASLILLCFASFALAEETALRRVDFLRCLSNIERVSQARLMAQPTDATQMANAMKCIDAHSQLSIPKAKELARVYEAYLVQLESPSAIAHSEVVLSSTIFLQGL